jgi:hypothetical protein
LNATGGPVSGARSAAGGKARSVAGTKAKSVAAKSVTGKVTGGASKAGGNGADTGNYGLGRGGADPF